MMVDHDFLPILNKEIKKKKKKKKKNFSLLFLYAVLQNEKQNVKVLRWHLTLHVH